MTARTMRPNRTSSTTRPARRRVGTLAAVVGAALLVAGCAGDGTAPDPPDDGTVDPGEPPDEGDDGTDPPDDEPPGDADPAHLPADLTIRVDPTGEGAYLTTTLTCDPVGGDHTDPEAACDALAAAGVAAFDPPPADEMCTQIYGGPQVAEVEGTVDGSVVRAGFSRTDGCEIARWDALVDLLGERGGAM